MICRDYSMIYTGLVTHHSNVFLSPNSAVYRGWMPRIEQAVKLHQKHLKPGNPQLNWCDPAVQVRKDLLLLA